MEIKKNTIHVFKTARYYLSGQISPEIRDLWFVCHGYGQLAADFIESFAPLNSPSRLIIAPEALHRFYLAGGIGRIGASWMTREEREDDIADYIAFLDQLYSEIVHSLPEKDVKITVLGFSQGTATAYRWSLLGNSPIHRLILWGGDVPADPPWENNIPRLQQLEIHLVTGTKDPYLKPESLHTQSQLLIAQHINSRVTTFNGTHEICPDALQKLTSP